MAAIDWVVTAARPFSSPSMSPSGSSTLSGGGSCIGSGAGPDDGTTNRSTRRTGRRAGRSKMRLNKTPIGRLSSKPPSLTQCGRVRLVNGAIAGRAGTSPFLAVPFVNGRKEGSNASGNEAELRAASASAGAVSGRARSVSVKVNRPRRSTSWTRVPNESVNLLVSPASSVVVMYRVVDGVRAASGKVVGGNGPVASLGSRLARAANMRSSPYKRDGVFLSRGSRRSSVKAPRSSQRSRIPPRSDPVTRDDASKAALMPPALVPDKMSTSTTMSRRSIS